MIRRVHQTIRSRRLFSAGDSVLVGVSGGADSVALLFALHFLRKRLGIRLAVAHLNHGIRGKAADADEDFVRLLALRLGLPFVSEKINVPALSRRLGVSVEMAARRARYEFFARHGSLVATAHTGDDQAETVLLRLLRGSGPQGLGGMSYRTERDGLAIARPMLDVTHADAAGFLRRHRRRWREDETNRDPDIFRNRVRHELLPMLESKFNPNVRRALRRMAEILREENEWLDGKVAAWLKACFAGAPERLSVGALGKHALAPRRRIIVRWLLLNGVEAEAVDFDAVERVVELASRAAGSQSMPISGSRRVGRRYDVLSVEETKPERASSFSVRLKVPGATWLPSRKLRVVTAHERGFSREAGAAYLSRSAVGSSALVLRSWKPGDRMMPLGMAGSRKVQDILVDLKVPREERGRVPILVCRGEVVWVQGYRVARGWEVSGARAESVRVAVEPV